MLCWVLLSSANFLTKLVSENDDILFCENINLVSLTRERNLKRLTLSGAVVIFDHINFYYVWPYDSSLASLELRDADRCTRYGEDVEAQHHAGPGIQAIIYLFFNSLSSAKNRTSYIHTVPLNVT